jgi:ferredoxin
MRIIADRTVCQGHGQCVFAAPDVFALDEEDRVPLKVEAHDDAALERAGDVAEVCPVQAITIDAES